MVRVVHLCQKGKPFPLQLQCWSLPQNPEFWGSKSERKRHININKFFWWLPGWRGGVSQLARGLSTGGQGSKVCVLCAEPKEYKHFRPGTRPGGSGTRPGGSVTGVTEKLFMCQMIMCLFRPLLKMHRICCNLRSTATNFSLLRPKTANENPHCRNSLRCLDCSEKLLATGDAHFWAHVGCSTR